MNNIESQGGGVRMIVVLFWAPRPALSDLRPLPCQAVRSIEHYVMRSSLVIVFLGHDLDSGTQIAIDW